MWVFFGLKRCDSVICQYASFSLSLSIYFFLSLILYMYKCICTERTVTLRMCACPIPVHGRNSEVHISHMADDMSNAKMLELCFTLHMSSETKTWIIYPPVVKDGNGTYSEFAGHFHKSPVDFSATFDDTPRLRIAGIYGPSIPGELLWTVGWCICLPNQMTIP